MPEVGDHYIRAEILLTRGDEMARGHVVARSCDANKNVISRAHVNAILNTRMYWVEFTGDKVTELTTNTIAESMNVQCDAYGSENLHLEVLIDYHEENNTIFLTEQQTSIQGRPVTHKTTADWQICCQWKDSSTSWEKLSNLKESHPVYIAEFAVVQEIDRKPTFNWWVSTCLRKEIRLLPASECGRLDI